MLITDGNPNPSSRTKLPQYKKGGMVRKTGPAIVHKGEMVIPKKQVPVLRKSMGMAGTSTRGMYAMKKMMKDR